jgi:hypothetical protein
MPNELRLAVIAYPGRTEADPVGWYLYDLTQREKVGMRYANYEDAWRALWALRAAAERTM